MVAPAVAGDVTVYGRAQVELTSVSFQTESDGTNYPDGSGGFLASCDGAAQDATVSNKCDGLEVSDQSLGRVGFKASEDLGNGWKGLAKFEYKADTADGSASSGVGLTARETMVGLKGGAVQIEAGRLKSAYKYAGGVKYDAFVTTTMEARGNGGMSGTALGHNGFLSKHLAVQGGSGPIKARLTYGAADGDGSLTGSVMYSQNNIEAFVAIVDSGDLQDDGGATETSYSATKLGGAFTTGPHKIMLQYEMVDEDDADDPTILFLGYNMKMGKNTFVVQLGQYDSDQSATPNDDMDYLALGVIHKFTKTTRLFGGFRSTDADKETREDVVTVGLRKDF
jgi:predicted porin